MIFYRLILIAIVLFLTTSSGKGAEVEDVTLQAADTTMQLTDSAYLKYRLDSMEIEANSLLRTVRAENADPHEAIVEVIGVLIPVVFLLLTGIIIYRRIEATRHVRLAMIQNGMDPGLLNAAPDENSRKYGALRIGLLLLGIGFGLLIGLITSESMHLDEEVAVFTVIASSLLFGGAGLVLYHRMIAKMDSKG